MNRSLLILLISAVVILFACNKMKDVPTNPISAPMSSDVDWKTIDSLEEKGLYRSAWDGTLQIYEAAKASKDYQTQYKALCYQLKYAARVEDGSEQDAVKKLEEVADQADMPLKAIAHSMAAEAYWNYFQQNQWQIMQRTPNAGAEDIEFWDLQQFVDHCDAHFAASLAHPEALKAIQIKDLNPELLTQKENNALRPTLYEMLAYRALGFYGNQNSGLARPKTFFQVNEPWFYAPATEFSNHDLSQEDTLAFAYRAIGIYQDLLRIQTQGSDAWLSTDLERLRYVSRMSNLPDKDGLVKDTYMMSALEQAIKAGGTNPMLAEYQVEIARLYQTSAHQYSEGADPTKKELLNQAEQVCQQAIADYPGSRGAMLAQNILLDIRQPSLAMNLEEVILPEQAALARITYKNVDELWFRLVEVPHDFVTEQNRNQEEMVRALLRQPIVETWSMKLPESADHQSHSVEAMIPSMPTGYYYLIASTEPEFKNKQGKVYGGFWATHIGLTEGALSKGGTEIRLLNRDSGLPLINAELIHYAYSYDRNYRKRIKTEIARYRSDAKGYVRLSYGGNRQGQCIEVNWNDEFYFSDIYVRQAPGVGGERQTVNFFLDRSIYRPGQTLYFKGICLTISDGDPAIRPNQDVEVTLRDANYQEVSKQVLRSNEFGSISGTFSLPSAGLTGMMTLQTPFGGTSFSVEEYKRPKFKVEMDKLEGVYALGDKVQATGKAMGYNGAPITDAQVRYSVSRTPVRKWYYWSWWYRPSYANQSPVQITSGKTETDAGGKFEFEFEALAANASGGDDVSHYNYAISVEVIDINGETREGSSSVNIGDKGLSISADLPQQIDKQSIPEVNISSENLNGQDVSMSGQWELRYIAPRKEEKVNRLWNYPQFQGPSDADFESKLPLHYTNKKDEGPFDSRSGAEDEGELVTSGEWNTAIDDDWDSRILQGRPVGRYILKLIAQDGEEPTTWSSAVTLFDSKKNETAFEEGLVALDLAGPYLPGQEASVLISSLWKDAPVQIRLEHDRKIVWEKELTLDQSQEIIHFPIKKSYQEGVYLHITMLRHDRGMKQSLNIPVTAIDRLLDISLETYRDKMQPGAKEEWRIKVAAQNGDKAISEMLLSMYDASLDQFKAHAWSFNPWSFYSPRLDNRFKGMGTAWSQTYAPDWYTQRSYAPLLSYPQLNRFGYQPFMNYGMYNEMSMESVGDGRPRMMRSKNMSAEPAMEADGMVRNEAEMDFAAADSSDDLESKESESGTPPVVTSESKGNESGPAIRKNFQETAFFYPDLKTDGDGNMLFSFTMPESLTTWKFQAFAHSKKLQSGTCVQEVITQKDLMVVPNSPRFLREGDRMALSTKLVSLTETSQTGSIRLELLDAMSQRDITAELFRGTTSKPFLLKEKGNEAFEWSFEVPDTYSAITYRFIAEGDKHSDGEEDVLPVLSNRKLVTEAMPFAILKQSERTFTFDRMAEADASSTAKPHALTLEFTANPIWYAVQAMPYMMEYPYDCSEQVFTRYYANTLATSVIADRPRLRQVIETWKELSPDAFLSNLEKNQELKYVLLEETPWVMDAKNESERKKRLSLLLDMNHMSNRQQQAFQKLLRKQTSAGGWAWFDGMRPNLYITQYIVSGLGHLKQLGILDESDPRMNQMISSAINYIDREHLERFRRMKRYAKNWKTENHTGSFEIQYLYARSFFDQAIQNSEAFDYYKEQAATYWVDRSVYMQGMSALALHRLGNASVPQDIMRSVKEQSMQDEELGMYWKNQRNGWYWYDAGIERHALMVEAFSEIMQDAEAVYGLKQWLIFNKQTNDWETTRATAEACYALLLGGNDWTQDREWIIEVGKEKFSSTDPALKTEAGTGYLKRRWEGEDIKEEMKTVKVTKEGEAPAWGALYYQYFEQLDKISASESPLEVRKQVFKVKQSDTGEQLTELNDGSELTVGDRIRIRMEVATDREMEYVHIKDMRSAGMEPVDVLSGMVYSGGLGFYRNTRDASTNFFIDNLQKGSYVLEYDVFVSHRGDFSNGITTIQCMYAPEFTAHSEGIRVVVR